MHTPVPLLTLDDVARLRELLASVPTAPPEAANLLRETLSRGRVVEATALPPDVVALDCRLVFRDEDSGRDREGWLVCPSEADPETNRMSVLTPLGAVLFGARIGDSLVWRLPRGGERLVTVTSVQHPRRG